MCNHIYRKIKVDLMNVFECAYSWTYRVRSWNNIATSSIDVADNSIGFQLSIALPVGTVGTV